MTQQLLSQPVPVVFAVCQGVQQLANGAFNILGIFDRLTVYQLPDGTRPDAITLQVVTVWTGGQGRFEHVLRLLDEDGAQVLEARGMFQLPSTSARHYQVNLVTFPIREGKLTMTIARAGDELLRQDFTIEVAPFPGNAP